MGLIRDNNPVAEAAIVEEYLYTLVGKLSGVDKQALPILQQAIESEIRHNKYEPEEEAFVIAFVGLIQRYLNRTT